MTKKRIAVIFGGRSGEHEVSLRSAESIIEALDPDKYEVFPVGITKEGRWLAGGDPWKVLKEKSYPGECCQTALITDPVNPGFLLWKETEGGNREIVSFEKIDAVFPVLHGPYGEDGTVQGLLEMANVPYVGSGVLGSSLGMDKVAMKKMFVQNQLPVGKYLFFLNENWSGNNDFWIKKITEEIGFPCFIKPANLGSSVGISKSYNEHELSAGINEALNYDNKILVEAFIYGREIECSVLGDRDVTASVPGEIIPNNDFYDYKAKYVDDRSELIIPANLDSHLTRQIQDMAIESFKVIEGSGMARVDFFVDTEKKYIFINEINTIPGFTSISMYPKLWAASGLPYKQLIDRLIDIALKRHVRRAGLRNSPPA